MKIVEKCPTCLNTPSVCRETDGHGVSSNYVKCNKCGTRSQDYYLLTQAIKYWNAREDLLKEEI